MINNKDTLSRQGVLAAMTATHLTEHDGVGLSKKVVLKKKNSFVILEYFLLIASSL